jgi:hypothetical protein
MWRASSGLNTGEDSHPESIIYGQTPTEWDAAALAYPLQPATLYRVSASADRGYVGRRTFAFVGDRILVEPGSREQWALRREEKM